MTRDLVLTAALLALSSCGSDEYPPVGSGPTGYNFVADGGSAPGPFQPGVAAGGAGSRSSSGATAATGTTTAGQGNSAGSTSANGVTPGGTGTGGSSAPSFACGAIFCSASEFCLVQAATSPELAPAAECRLIPGGCTSCDCVKPRLDCVCAPQANGALIVSCP